MTARRQPATGGRYRIDDGGAHLALMQAILWRLESLPGALCRGHAPAFDADRLDGEGQRAYRLRLARASTICHQCPERVRCPAPIVGSSLSRAG